MKGQTIKTDILVIGSGSGGMMTALTAKTEGLDALVIEKAPHYGGSSAMSGGGMWVPNNHVMQKAGIKDSPEMAKDYLKHTAKTNSPAENQAAFVQYAPEMAKYLEGNSDLKLQMATGYPDYHQEVPGAIEGGRSLEPEIFYGSKLNGMLKEIHPPYMPIPGGLAFTIYDFKQMGMMKTSGAAKWHALKVMMRNIKDLALRRKPLGMGYALMAGLRHALARKQIPVWLNTEVKEFTTEQGRVTGVTCVKGGETVTVVAKKAVVLASGGFEHNEKMRKQYQQEPITVKWTVGADTNTGEMIEMAKDLGAQLALMDAAWWGPSSILPDGKPMFHVGERSYPGGIMVDSSGKRFTNESASYVTVVHDMYDRHNKQNIPAIPSYLVFDQRFRNNYMLGTLMPGKTPKEFIDSGYIKRADTLDELATMINADAANLKETVNTFNEYARNGKDEDFGRGNSAYDRYYGDSSVKPNPCLAPIDKAPFYAVELVPGDLGTSGGVATNAHAQVLNNEGSPIEGLYATGNCTASVMGHSYPGPGASIGAAMTFGYVAAMHAKNEKS